jgi:hypothetical protein
MQDNNFIFMKRPNSKNISLEETGSTPDEATGFFNWSNPSSSSMAVGSTQSLTAMSTRNLPVGKERPARKADDLIAISEPTV